MNRNTLVVILSVLILFIAAVHLGAMQLNLYFHVWWFDLVMHFLGGAWAGLFSLYSLGSRFERASASRTLVFALIGALVFGIAWEFYEYYFGFTFTTKSSYAFDTVLDLIMDSLGGILSGALFALSVKKQRYV